MKYIIIATVFFMSTSATFAAHRHYERYYQESWCQQHSGETEYRLDDGTRVDCLLNDYAIEFDFAAKWAEAIGQSLYYGIKTNRKPAIVLIIETGTDKRYLDRVRQVADIHGITVWTTGEVAE